LSLLTAVKLAGLKARKDSIQVMVSQAQVEKRDLSFHIFHFSFVIVEDVRGLPLSDDK
jgi:hypothetical protein